MKVLPFFSELKVIFTVRYTIVSLFIISVLIWACGGTDFQQGHKLYDTHCASCHMEDGSGLGQLIPPLAGADYLKENNLATACIIRYGLVDSIVVNGKQYGEQPMAGIAELSEFQIVNIMNYINQAWGNEYGFVKVADVRDQLAQCDPKAEQ